MKPSQHIVASAGISLGLQLTLHSWPATLGCFFSGFLIDLDHHLDYCIVHKQFPFKYQDLVDFCWDTKVTKLYLFLHSYELLCIFWFLIYYLSLGKVWMGVALGLTTHMILDQFFNPIKPLFYLIIYRAMNGFEKSKILTDRYFN